MINPCYHCGRRYIGCHAECGDYKAWAEEYERVSMQRREVELRDRRLDSQVISFHIKRRKLRHWK